MEGFFLPAARAHTAPVTLKLSPLQGYSPFSTRGRVVTPPDPNNREWCLVWDSEDGEAGLSCKPLDGEAGAVTHDILLKELSAGLYIVKAVVVRSGGKEEWSNPVQVNVLKGGPE